MASRLSTNFEEVCKNISPDILSSRITDNSIAEIAQDLVDWEEIAPFIGITESEQKEIKEDYHGRYNLQKRAALLLWRFKHGDEATYKALIKILCTQGLTLLAQQLVCTVTLEINDSELPRKSIDIEMFRNYLLDCYHILSHPSEKQWPTMVQSFLSPSDPCAFIDLTLHKTPLMDMQSTSVIEVKLNEVFKPEAGRRQIILFEGIAGSGKTTLCWYACKEWAGKRLLQQFDLFIYIQLNDPQLQKAKQLADFIPEVDKDVCRNLTLAIADRKGAGICLLLDGLDEAQPNTLNTCFNVIMGRESAKYPQLSFIMTTRPNSNIAQKLLPVIKTKISIMGFSKSKLQDFLRANLNSDDHKHMEEQLKIIPQLEGLCGLPINAAIMMFLSTQYNGQISFSKTQTGLYKQLVCNFLVRHTQTRTAEGEPNAIESFDHLPLNIQAPFKQLCELAYLSATKKKRLFTISDLEKAAVKIDDTLGLLRSYQRITFSGIQRHYSFHHTSVHDFLAAIHILQMKESEQVSAIKVISEDALSQVIPFYAGLSKLTNRKVLLELSKVFEKPLDDRNTMDSLTNNPVSSNDPRRKALTMFQCLFECQDDSLLQLPETQLVQYGSLAGNKEFTDGKFANSHVVCLTCLNLSPIDCIAIAYYIKVKSLTVKEKSLIYLRMGRCSDIAMTSFFKEIRDGIRIYTPTRVLVGLTHSFLSRTTLSALRDALIGPSNIDQLRITRRAEVNSVNIKSKDVVYALKCIVEGLAKNSSCISVVLDGFSTEKDEIHMHAFYTVLMMRACTLRDLHYCKASFQKSMHLISEAIKLSTLKSLVLNYCNIDDTALLQLGHGVCKNQSLITVTVAFNPYTLNGVMNFLRLFVNNDISSLYGFIIESSVMTQLRQNGEFYLLLFVINSARSDSGKNPLVPAPFDFILANMEISGQMAWREQDMNTLSTTTTN